jgi:hypothetical protein
MFLGRCSPGLTALKQTTARAQRDPQLSDNSGQACGTEGESRLVATADAQRDAVCGRPVLRGSAHAHRDEDENRDERSDNGSRRLEDNAARGREEECHDHGCQNDMMQGHGDSSPTKLGEGAGALRRPSYATALAWLSQQEVVDFRGITLRPPQPLVIPRHRPNPTSLATLASIFRREPLLEHLGEAEQAPAQGHLRYGLQVRSIALGGQKQRDAVARESHRTSG